MIDLVEYMKYAHTGKAKQISYKKLFQYLTDILPDIENEVTLRHHMNRLFADRDEVLVSTGKGVYVAENKQDIDECADRLIRHGIAEIVRGYKMKKLPLDGQIKILLEEM